MSKHQKQHKSVSIKQTNLWKISAIMLGILLLVSVFTDGLRFDSGLDRAIRELNQLNNKESSAQVKEAINEAILLLENAKTNQGNSQISGDVVRGPEEYEGLVLIEEFSDFQCPYCQRALATIRQINQEYGDKVVIVYKHFPLSSIHPDAQKAAEASECARDQGKFWEYHDKLFENPNALKVNNLKSYAADLGLNTGTFNTCLDSNSKSLIVSADFTEGQQKGVTGTPTFFINGEKIVGAQPFEVFKSVIDAQLQ